jgi:hypothetical protein
LSSLSVSSIPLSTAATSIWLQSTLSSSGCGNTLGVSVEIPSCLETPFLLCEELEDFELTDTIETHPLLLPSCKPTSLPILHFSSYLQQTDLSRMRFLARYVHAWSVVKFLALALTLALSMLLKRRERMQTRARFLGFGLVR